MCPCPSLALALASYCSLLQQNRCICTSAHVAFKEANGGREDIRFFNYINRCDNLTHNKDSNALKHKEWWRYSKNTSL